MVNWILFRFVLVFGKSLIQAFF